MKLKKRYRNLAILVATLLLVSTGCSSSSSSPEETTATQTVAESNMEETQAETTGANESETTSSNEVVDVDADPVTLKLGLSFADSHLITQELYEMAEQINTRTSGGVTIEIYADSLLGSETEMYEQLYMGTIDMILETIAFQSTTHPELTVEDLPYMFATSEDGYAALDGEYGAAINEIIAESGEIRNLGYMELGYRHITNNVRPIEKPEDLEGIKIRTTTSDLRLAFFEMLGAQPTSMSFSEVFTGLQQNVIDAQESPLTTIVSSSFAEVQTYLSLTGQFWTNECLLVNEATWSGFPEEWQQIIQEEVNECVTRIREGNAIEEEELIAQLEEDGMQINEVDKSLFREAVLDLYDEYESVIGADLMAAYEQYSGY